MIMKIFYNNKQSGIKTNTPSSEKAQLFIDELKINFNKKIEIISNFDLLNKSDIALAHSTQYINDILNNNKSNGYHLFNKDIIKKIELDIAFFFYASMDAWINKSVTCSPTSAFHHAGYDFSGGFCTFNGLIITAQLLKLNFNIDRIAIVYLDIHHGNGTEDIIKKLGLNYIDHFSLEKELKKYKTNEELMNNLEYAIFNKIDQADIILYQAGADPHINDPLGGLLTTEQMYQRDLILFKLTKEMDVPLV